MKLASIQKISEVIQHSNADRLTIYKLEGVDFRVFHVWRLEDRKLLDYDEMVDFCNKLDIPTVDLYYVGDFKWDSVEEMIEEARKVKYKNGAKAEGLVWKLRKNEYCDKLQKYLSVKTINYDYKD